MAGTQLYLGIKNGVVVCVDRYYGYDLSGYFYHSYSRDPVYFDDGAGLLKKLENLFDVLNFPQPATSERYFESQSNGKKHGTHKVERPYEFRKNRNSEREKVMSDNDILGKHGDAGTFIVRVQQRQNSSWQGRITWVDEDKTVYFRSVFEMMKLIDEALNTACGETDNKEATWQ